MDKVSITQAKALINDATNIVITAHKNPDGDAVGSSLALFHYLKGKNKNLTSILPNGFPDFFNWMPGSDEILIFEVEEEKARKAITDADLIFSLDYNALHRTGDMKESLESAKAPFILIDHHQQPEDFTVSFSDVTSCSTAQMIYQFCYALEENEDWITNEFSQCVYTGIMTDTGSFRFPLANAETHEIIAVLKRKGLDHAYVHQSVSDSNSLSRLKLLGYALGEKLEVISGTKAAMIALNKEELEKFDYKSGDTEGVVNYALSISGINLAILVKEGNNIVKLSFRSKGKFDVNTLARTHFDGGGHINAAGGASILSFDETLEKVKQTVRGYAKELDY